MILTSATMTGTELESAGLVSKVFSNEDVLPEAIKCAQKIAERSSPVVKLAKSAILEGKSSYFFLFYLCRTAIWPESAVRLWWSNPWLVLLTSAAEQSSLELGMKYERSLYYSTFSLHDKHEGMTAFLEKRPPVFKHC